MPRLLRLFVVGLVLTACEQPLPPLPDVPPGNTDPPVRTPFGRYAMTSLASQGLPYELAPTAGIEAGTRLLADTLYLGANGSLSGHAILQRPDGSRYTTFFVGTSAVQGEDLVIVINGDSSVARLQPWPNGYSLLWPRWDGLESYYWYFW